MWVNKLSQTCYRANKECHTKWEWTCHMSEGYQENVLTLPVPNTNISALPWINIMIIIIYYSLFNPQCWGNKLEYTFRFLMKRTFSQIPTCLATISGCKAEEWPAGSIKDKERCWHGTGRVNNGYAVVIEIRQSIPIHTHNHIHQVQRVFQQTQNQSCRLL